MQNEQAVGARWDGPGCGLKYLSHKVAVGALGDVDLVENRRCLRIAALLKTPSDGAHLVVRPRLGHDQAVIITLLQRDIRIKAQLVATSDLIDQRLVFQTDLINENQIVLRGSRHRKKNAEKNENAHCTTGSYGSGAGRAGARPD
ncbi:hypothetical protein PXK08_06160 [Phaeobacter gallaeciensis]|nr:hypothetical protein [Phaeobacter gallaeciensis]